MRAGGHRVTEKRLEPDRGTGRVTGEDGDGVVEERDEVIQVRAGADRILAQLPSILGAGLLVEAARVVGGSHSRRGAALGWALLSDVRGACLGGVLTLE